MKFLLDTNIVSYWMRGDERIIKRLSEKTPRDLALSAITYAEILYGIEKSPVRKRERKKKLDLIAGRIEIFPFDAEASRHYAPIRAHLERKGTVISERDLQIAAIGRANGFGIVTHNVKEFTRIPELTVEDWAVK